MRKSTIAEAEARPLEVEGPKEADVQVEDRPQCRHHWLIETPQGATSKGVCKVCGEEREFRNASTGAYWESDSSSDGKDWGRRARTPVIAAGDEEELSMAPSEERTALVV